MPTSVRIPKPLLTAVDRKARALQISRNRLIVRALEREVPQRDWSGFCGLRDLDDRTRDALRRTMDVVLSARTSKGPPRL